MFVLCGGREILSILPGKKTSEAAEHAADKGTVSYLESPHIGDLPEFYTQPPDHLTNKKESSTNQRQSSEKSSVKQTNQRRTFTTWVPSEVEADRSKRGDQFSDSEQLSPPHKLTNADEVVSAENIEHHVTQHSAEAVGDQHAYSHIEKEQRIIHSHRHKKEGNQNTQNEPEEPEQLAKDEL